MRANLEPLFGKIPVDADNLEIVGEFPRRLQTWSNVTVWPGTGVVRRAGSPVEIESIWIPENLRNCGDFHSRWSAVPARKIGTYFNLSLFWWQNYYHWHCDVLPRLLWALPQLPAEVLIILPPGMTSWQKRSLDLIGVSMDRCVTFGGRRPWRVERLVWAAPLAMTGDHEQAALIQLRECMWKKLNCKPEVAGWRRLYLLRKNTHGRRVTNEEEILGILKDYGFQAVDCGELTYDDQVKVFSESKVVIGPHGASFTNLLWSAPNTLVLEVFEPGSVRRCYWSLCNALGHFYSCGVAVANNQVGREPDMIVDPETFADSLKNLLQTNNLNR